jgi:hypothetical protein
MAKVAVFPPRPPPLVLAAVFAVIDKRWRASSKTAANLSVAVFMPARSGQEGGVIFWTGVPVLFTGRAETKVSSASDR